MLLWWIKLYLNEQKKCDVLHTYQLFKMLFYTLSLLTKLLLHEITYSPLIGQVEYANQSSLQYFLLQ